jgi:Leucine-rich repeat (LRR) protein
MRRIEAVRKTDATLLDLSNLKLIALPEAIGRLTALTKLWLKNNQLKALPPQIRQLTALKNSRLHQLRHALVSGGGKSQQ